MNNPIIDELEKAYLGKELPEMNAGDTVKVFVKIVEGNKERIQAFEGTIIKMHGSGLRLTIKPLAITPSEPLGEVFEACYFRSNPYLYKAASYIYQGCHFGMPATEIEIDTTFRLRFIKTLDHRFDKMFSSHNWSKIGYPHFGDGGFCAGEFNDTMAHAREYELGYFFISLKQYLGTANMRDLAGVKVFWYPIYNNDNE